MTYLCDFCTKINSDDQVISCKSGHLLKRYREQCEGFAPSSRFKPYVDEIISFLGIQGEAKTKMLALKELYDLYLTRNEVLALELAAHNVDGKFGYNACIDGVINDLESAHEKLVNILMSSKVGEND